MLPFARCRPSIRHLSLAAFVLLLFCADGSLLRAQSVPLPTDRARVQVVSIPDAYNPSGPPLKVLRTDANTPLRAGTAWIWEKQGQEENEAYYAKLRANGLNAVRMILFDTWEVEAYAPSPDFTPTDWNNSAYRTRQLARMERAVNYASDHGLYVVINSHNKIPNYAAAYVDALWTHVAPYFANRTHVLYEAANEPMSGIGRNGDMDEPTGAANSARLQALKTTYNLIRAAAPQTHILILTPPGINDHAFGTGLGNLAATFAALPGVVDWAKTSVAYHLYGNDRGFGTAAVNAFNLRNLHSRFPGWPSENAFPPGDFPGALGLDQWRSIPFDNDLWVNQTCERLGLGWSMWFINGHTQFDTNFPLMMADANAKGWNWVHDPLTAPPTAAPAAGNITGPTNVALSTATPGASIRYTLDGSQPSPTLGTLYTGTPIPLSATTTLRAVAFGDGIPISATRTLVYTLVVPVANVRVNAGGPAVGDFALDGGFSTSNIQGSGASVATAGIDHAAPAALYDTERWNAGPITYTSPVLEAGRSYTVRLHFAERYVGAANQRRFNVSINGATAGALYAGNFDVFAAAGNAMNRAVVRSFSGVAPLANGTITLTLSIGSVQLPMINGLEILAEPTPWETWLSSRFSPAQQANPSTIAPTGDPDGDGAVNLLEYALATDPVLAGGSPLLSELAEVAGASHLTLRFTRHRAELRYIVQSSPDLLAWTIVATDPGLVGQEVTVLDPVAVTDASPRRFLRLLARQPAGAN